MIKLTRINGLEFVVNSDLIERIDTTPDTTLTLIDGHHYLVTESLEEVVDRIREWRISTTGAPYTSDNGTRATVSRRLHAITHEDKGRGR